MNNQPLFSVVIPVRNNREKLAITLDSIVKTDMDKSLVEVVVVDDGSTDGTYEEFSQKQYSFQFKIFNHDFGGQSAATNEAIRHSTGKYILSSASDIIFDKNLFKEHLKWHEKFNGEDIVVLGNLPYPTNLDITPFMFYLVNGGEQFAYYLIKDRLSVPPHFLYAPNFSVKRDVLIKVGLFDVRFPFGSQDTDLGIRLVQTGVRIVYNSEAVGYHNHPVELEQFFRRQEMAGTSVVLLHKKHPLFQDFLVLWYQIIRNYLAISKIEYDFIVKNIKHYEDLIVKNHPSYQMLWQTAHNNKIALNRFKPKVQETIRITHKLFQLYDSILKYYWSKGFFEEAINIFDKQKIDEIIHTNLHKIQFTIQKKNVIQKVLKKHLFHVKLISENDYLNSLIIYDVSDYSSIVKYLMQFLNPIDNICNSQIIIVVEDGKLSPSEVDKIKEVSQVIKYSSTNIGLGRALKQCQSEIITITSCNVVVNYASQYPISTKVFNNLSNTAIIGGNLVDKTGQMVKYAYYFDNRGHLKQKKVSRKIFNNSLFVKIDVAIPEYMIVRGSLLSDYYEVSTKSTDNISDNWFLKICALAHKKGMDIYHVPQLEAHYHDKISTYNF